MKEWRALSGRSGVTGALHDGIPPWLDRPLGSWIDRAVRELSAPSVVAMMGPMANSREANLVAQFDLRARLVDPLAPRIESGRFLSEVLRERGDLELTLDFVDFLLMRADVVQPWPIPTSEQAKALEELLEVAGSAWRVGNRAGFVGLERRVEESVLAAAEEIIGDANSAGRLLGEAWQAIYGRKPDPEEAYEKAIKAVEEAGAHVVSPDNRHTTLGTMARDMESQRDWTVPLTELPRHPSQDAVVKLVRMLWSGQESRHGGNGYRKPTQHEAEAAVLIAVVLVQFFSSGLLARRP